MSRCLHHSLFTWRGTLILLSAILVALAPLSANSQAANWPRRRGPDGTGISTDSKSLSS
jgi:hypothetical protein